MKSLLVLLKRDIRNSINKRLFFMLGFMLLFQTWFIIGSDSVGQVRDTGEMFYMAVVFSFNFLGAVVALALNHDSISVEREAKFLDLVLTSGVSKKKVYLSKVIASFVTSGVFAVFYTLGMMLLYWGMSGDLHMGLSTWRYALPITVFLTLFSLIGLMLSILFRSSKTSLITSIILGVLVMPRLIVMVVDGLGSLLGLSDLVTDRITLISPALIMNALNGYADTPTLLWALLLLLVYLAITILAGLRTFVKQDELNYGE